MERMLRLAIWLAAVLLSSGLVLWLAGSPAAASILHAGLWVLIAAPMARVLTALAGYSKERDWTFAALTLIVLACLVFPIVRFLLALQG